MGTHLDTSPRQSTPPTTTRLLRQGLLRALVPLVILWAMALAQQLTDQPSGAWSTFVVGVIAAAVAGFSVIYDIDAWSLLKRSVVHTGAMTVIVLPCLFLSGWFPIDEPIDVLVVLGFFVIIGLVTWSVGYLVFGKLRGGA